MDILYSEDEKIDFEIFNRILKSILPEEVSGANDLVTDEVLEND